MVSDPRGAIRRWGDRRERGEEGKLQRRDRWRGRRRLGARCGAAGLRRRRRARSARGRSKVGDPRGQAVGGDAAGAWEGRRLRRLVRRLGAARRLAWGWRPPAERAGVVRERGDPRRAILGASRQGGLRGSGARRRRLKRPVRRREAARRPARGCRRQAERAGEAAGPRARSGLGRWRPPRLRPALAPAACDGHSPPRRHTHEYAPCELQRRPP